MKTYWEFITMRRLVGRFVCAECCYDSMSRRRNENGIFYDCVFCGWSCTYDWLGRWWHLNLSHEWEMDGYQEE